MMMMSFRPSLLVSILFWSATTANENGGAYYNTITDLVLETPELSTLADLLQLTGLDETLDDKYAYFTVFAPRDAAFERLDPDVLQSLLKDSNRDLLKDTLLYHGTCVCVCMYVSAYLSCLPAFQLHKILQVSLCSLHSLRWMQFLLSLHM